MEMLSDAGLAKDITCIGVPDGFLPFGAVGDVMESVGMDTDSVVERILATLS